MKDFDAYMIRVREQLYCNATNEYKSNNVTYGYSNEQVDSNLNYFLKSMKSGLSEYKALLFFGDYLRGDYKLF